MARAKADGKKGIDRWTNNGYGLVYGKPVITKEQAAKIDAEAKKNKGKKK